LEIENSALFKNPALEVGDTQNRAELYTVPPDFGANDTMLQAPALQDFQQALHGSA